MAGRILLVGVFVFALVAANGQPNVAEVSDPCGDISYVQAQGERVPLQPDEWSSFDLEHVSIAEVDGLDGARPDILMTFDLCGPAREPDSMPEGFQNYRVSWDVGGGCHRVVQVGWEGTSIQPISGVGVWTWSSRYVAELCPEFSAGSTGVWEHTHDYEIPEDALAFDGDRLTVRLRATDYPALADGFAPGAVYPSALVTTQPVAPAPGVGGCLPPDGPTGTTCSAVRDGDRAQLPDLVLSDQ